MYLTVLLQFSGSYVRALKANTALSFRTLSGCIFQSAPPLGLLSHCRLPPPCLDKWPSSSLGGWRLLPLVFSDTLRSGVISQKGVVDESLDYEDGGWRDMVAPAAGESARGGLHLRRRRVDNIL